MNYKTGNKQKNKTSNWAQEWVNWEWKREREIMHKQEWEAEKERGSGCGGGEENKNVTYVERGRKHKCTKSHVTIQETGIDTEKLKRILEEYFTQLCRNKLQTWEVRNK